MAQPSSYSDLSPRRQPFLFLTTAFVIGILTDRWLAPPFWLTAAMLAGLIVGAAILFCSLRKPGAAIIILAGFMAAGCSVSAAVSPGARTDGLKRLMDDGQITPTEPVRLIGVLGRPPEPVPDGVLLDVSANELQVARRILRTSGSARLMLQLSGAQVKSEYNDLHLDYGAQVSILIRLEPARAFSNPGSPDFNEFLERRGYQLKGTIKSPLLIEVLKQGSGNPFLGAL